jgi:carbon-monoxide dehydrogenase small subunit
MLMSAASLLQHNPAPSDDEIVEALEGNLCRCTGYVNIVAAVRQAAQVMAEGAAQ